MCLYFFILTNLMRKKITNIVKHEEWGNYDLTDV